MIGTAYREFVDIEYTRFRRALLRTKGSEQQRKFLEAVRDDEKFLTFLRGGLATTGTRDLPLCPERMTEGEFKNPPSSTEADLYTAWKDLTPRVACRTTFWASVTCDHIEEGKIQAVFLAANGGGSATASERIDRALYGGEDNPEKTIDGCVRTIFRRLGGLPDARGNRTVYVDCPLARAWWRERLVAEISKENAELANRVRAVVRVNQAYWEELVNLIVSRNSVVGSHEIRDAFVLSLAELLIENPETPLRISKNLRLACRNIGVIQASRELSVLDGNEIRTLMDGIVEAHSR